ncbi:unnamed protein product, partial [Trypanosoma congolense IL3000]
MTSSTAKEAHSIPAASADPELRAEALKRFNPLVFAVSVETPNNICVPRLNEAIMRDPTFSKCLYVLDSGAVDSVSNSRQRVALGGRQKQSVDANRPVSSLLYDDFVRFAVEREMRRRAELQAREAERNAIAALYIEDGLGEEEALAAAEKEILEAEAADETSSIQEDGREPLFLFLRTCPHSVEDIMVLRAAGLSLHVIISVSSRVPLSGSLGDETPTTTASGKGRSKRDAGHFGRGSKDAASLGPKPTVAAELREYMRRTQQPDPYLKNIYIHEFNIPTEPIGPKPTQLKPSGTPPADCTPDSPATHRLKGTEMSVFNDLVDTIVKLEQEYSSYCEWKCTRVETRVPTYLALKYIRPVGNQAVAGDRERRRAMSFRKKLSSVHLVQPPCGEAVPVFDDNPTRMSDVTAHRDVYDEILGRRRLGAVDWKLFCSACLRQVESTSNMDAPETLGLFVPSVKREEQQMLKDRDKALEFVNYLFDVVDQGGSVAYRNRLSGVKSAGNAGFRNEDTFGLFWTVSSCDICLTGKDSTTPADAIVSECVDADMREAIISALRSSFDVDLERAKQLVAEVTSMGVISRSNQTDVEKFLKVNKHTSWRSAHVKMVNCDVDIYYRGEEQRRTESGVYTFRGPISFSEYVNMRAYCAGEELYYNPPPLDSDEESGVEEEEEEEENEEEEEEEEDYDGIDWEAREKIKEEKRKEKMERRLKKREKVEEAPYVDVVNVAVTTLRRRCVYEDLLRRLNSHRTETKLDQQLFASGPGACCVSQEVQWMFADDGCAIEVRRIVANARQVECCVSSPGGLEFGFLTLDTAPQEGTLLVIPCGLRCYFTVVDEVQFFFEVLADNSDAVAQMAYETAQENARRDAKVHRGMLESIKPSKNSKEKVVVPPLNVIEEEFISKIPPPVIRGKKPPVAQTTFLLQNGTIGAFHLNEQYLWLSVPRGSLHTTIANLSVDVWSSNKVRTARVNYIERIEVFSDGCLGIRCPEIRGFRVSLDTFGNYVTMDSGGALVRVDMFGNRTLVRPCGEVVNLEPIHVSTLTDSSSGRRVIVRQDGTQIILRYDGSLESLVYGAGLSCTRSGERFTWYVAGFPGVFVSPAATQVGLSFNNVEAVMDTNDNELRIVDHRGGSEALLKWKIHRLYVKPMVGGNTYTLDCAFGGLIGRSNATEYCVSTLGRCGNAREDVFNSPEVLSQQFLAYFEETSSKYEAAQLHRTISGDVVSFLLESQSTGNSSYTRASASCYGRFVNSEIEKLIPQGAKPCADMFRIVVRKHADSDIDSSILFFGGAWLSKLLMDRLKTYGDSTYVYPLAGASVNGKIVEERVLFLQAAKKTVTERGTMTPIAKSVADFLLIPSLPQSMLSMADDERDVLHVVLPKPEVPLSTTDVMDLLCIGRLVACEDNVWNEALKALPPSELTTLLPRK